MGKKVYNTTPGTSRNKILSACELREMIASEHYLDVSRVRVTCRHCRSSIGGDPSRWEADLSGMASHLGWRLEIEEGICECNAHRTDTPKQYSFDMSIKPENFYRTYLHVQGFFSLEKTPYLFSRLKPWHKGWEYDRISSFSKEEMRSMESEVLPEGQYLELRLVRISKMYPSYNEVVWRKGIQKLED